MSFGIPSIALLVLMCCYEVYDLIYFGVFFADIYMCWDSLVQSLVMIEFFCL